jgi:AraC family transcriptional regulator of adaptative response / methylphosphotriester-DNA alkyltransferase methyltransferase
MTPIHYINQLRVNKAAELLAHQDDAILDIAYATGFKSLSTFYECFKEQIGQPPNEYRRAIRHPNCDDK